MGEVKVEAFPSPQIGSEAFSGTTEGLVSTERVRIFPNSDHAVRELVDFAIDESQERIGQARLYLIAPRTLHERKCSSRR